MSALEAIVLGIVQGLTEFLPISSTAHLRIVPAFAGWEDPGAAFTAVTQLGTMAAVLLYFREDLLRIARAWFESLSDRPKRRELDARIAKTKRAKTLIEHALACPHGNILACPNFRAALQAHLRAPDSSRLGA